MTEIGVEYGTALFELACENDTKDEYAAALDEVEALFRENPQYTDFLASPGIPMGERLMALDTAFEGSVPEDVLNLLKLMCEKGRIYAFKGAVEEYRRLYKASRHISNVTVTSAVPLSLEQQSRLTAKLEKMAGNKVILNCVIDEKLMGGLTIITDDGIIDGSLKRRLREIKDVMTG